MREPLHVTIARGVGIAMLFLFCGLFLAAIALLAGIQKFFAPFGGDL